MDSNGTWWWDQVISDIWSEIVKWIVFIFIEQKNWKFALTLKTYLAIFKRTIPLEWMRYDDLMFVTKTVRGWVYSVPILSRVHCSFSTCSNLVF